MSMYTRFSSEVASAGLPAAPDSVEVVTSVQIASLPEPAQRNLDFMKVVGHPQDWSFRLGFTGRFRTKPKQAWMKCEAWQYDSRGGGAHISHPPPVRRSPAGHRPRYLCRGPGPHADQASGRLHDRRRYR